MSQEQLFGEHGRPKTKAKRQRPDRLAALNAQYRNNPVYRAKLRTRRFKNKYGITEADYDRMFERQWGCCAICGAPPASQPNYRDGGLRLAVDHCHKTGLVRGLLCTKCNTALGGARDDPEILRAMIVYLEDRHPVG